MIKKIKDLTLEEIIKRLKNEKKVINERLDSSIRSFNFADCIKMQSALTELRRICKLLNLESEIEIDEKED